MGRIQVAHASDRSFEGTHRSPTCPASPGAPVSPTPATLVGAVAIVGAVSAVLLPVIRAQDSVVRREFAAR